MLLFKTKYVIAFAEAWIQKDFSCFCLPLMGATFITFPTKNGGKSFNLAIPVLFFDIVVVMGTHPMTNN